MAIRPCRLIPRPIVLSEVSEFRCRGCGVRLADYQSWADHTYFCSDYAKLAVFRREHLKI